MSVKSGHLAQLLLIQRERDALRIENVRLRDKLLELANQCDKCDGAGVVNELKDPAWPYLGYRQVPCPKCEDIREVLKP